MCNRSINEMYEIPWRELRLSFAGVIKLLILKMV